jgi:HSP20 family protein
MFRTAQAKKADNPFREAQSATSWVDSILGPMFHEYRSSQAWQPAINIYEDPAGYCVVADLAGICTEEVDLRVEKGQLILSGQRPTPEPQTPERHFRMQLMEIDHGTFHRTLKLSEDIDADAISASYKSGFLWVRLPKKG